MALHWNTSRHDLVLLRSQGRWCCTAAAAKHRCQSRLHAIKASFGGREHMELQLHEALVAWLCSDRAGTASA